MIFTPNSSAVSMLSKPSGDIHKRQKLFHQQNLEFDVSESSTKNTPEAERQLPVMINHFITATAPPFHLSECPISNRMLVLARNTRNLYKPSRRDGHYLIPTTQLIKLPLSSSPLTMPNCWFMYIQWWSNCWKNTNDEYTFSFCW